MTQFFSFWAQGRENAPPLVQRIFELWEERVGTENFRVYDEATAAKVLDQLGIDWRRLTIALQSDLLRLAVLAEQGGAWVDATVYPRPDAAQWIENCLSNSTLFLPTHPRIKTLISSWLIAAKPGDPLIRKWLSTMTTFLSVPRVMESSRPKSLGFLVWRHQKRRRPSWTIDPEGGGKTRFAPYFTIHYAFDYVVRSDAVLWAHWQVGHLVFAASLHTVQRCFEASPPDMFLRMAPDLLASTPVQKLSWRKPWPDEFIDLLV